MDPEELNGQLNKRGVFLVTSVTHDVIEKISGWIVKNPDKKKFTLLIKSSGGSPSAIIRFASELRLLKKNVVIEGVAVDECGSAALALLQCCTKRKAVKHTSFFIHHIQLKISINCFNPNRKSLEAEIDNLKRLEDELIDLQCKRSGLSRKKWVERADYGENNPHTPIFTSEALKLGLIDEVIDSFPCL